MYQMAWTTRGSQYWRDGPSAMVADEGDHVSCKSDFGARCNEPMSPSATAPGRRYTADQLIAAATKVGYGPSRRLVTDWVAIGLLDRAEGRGRGRGKGKEYTWPSEQRDLFLALLKHHQTARRPVLCNIPVSIWLLWGDAYIPLRQVRRALGTWAAAYGTVSFTKAKDGAEQTLLQLDHPDAREQDRAKLRKLLTQAGKSGTPNLHAIDEATRLVIDPHGTGLSRGPMGLLDADAYLRILRARVEGIRAVTAATDEEYYAARRLYQSTGPVNDSIRRPLEPAPQTITPRLFGSTAGAGFQAPVNSACLDLITSLGINRLTPPTTAGFMTKEGPDRATTQP